MGQVYITTGVADRTHYSEGLKVFSCNNPYDQFLVNTWVFTYTSDGGANVYIAGFPENNGYYILAGYDSNFVKLGMERVGVGPFTEAATTSLASSGIPYSAIMTAYTPGYLNPTWIIEPYASKADAVAAIASYISGGNTITYRLSNCTAPDAPESAIPGSQVDIVLTPNAGFEFINPSSDIYVTNNGVAVAASYANGHLRFTMP